MYELLQERYLKGNLIQAILLSAGFAAITGLLAQIRIYLPWTPVPITGSTAGIIISGIFLGDWAILSVLLYVGLGIIGVPWFAGWHGGFSSLIGPTGGYLIGFILAGWFVGKIYRRINYVERFAALLFAHLVLIYLPGILGLALWLKIAHHSMPGILTLLMMGAVPFIPGDVLKSLVLALIPARE